VTIADDLGQPVAEFRLTGERFNTGVNEVDRFLADVEAHHVMARAGELHSEG
jgi:hypothetical protein